MAKPHSQLIQTKLSVPKLRSHVVSRTRLVERATAESGETFTLVSAPAGYGKTTLMVELSQALARSGTTIAWYALDSSDNDPNLFGSYLVGTLGKALQIEAALAPVARLLGSSAEPSVEKALPTVINALVATQQQCLLVLDDYHLITSPAIHSALAFLLDHLPENVRVVVGSRSDPPLPLGRLRAANHLAEIRAGDLRFTAEEATQFLNETMRLGLSSETVAEIETSTEGWVTGLQLAALSLAGRTDNGAFISRFGGSNRYLVEYLLQEVVERQTAEIQLFLISTSVLERLCGPLCDAVLDWESGSEAILHRLEQANLFIVSLDDGGYWYRYHHLFRDFLRTRLNQSQPDRMPLLHRAASEWFASQGLLSEAVSHALETRDWDYAAEVVERHGMPMVTRSEISTLCKWCESFSEGIFRSHPLLCILHGWALSLSYRKEKRGLVEKRVQQAEQAISALDDEQRARWLTGQAELVLVALSLIPDPTTNPERQIALAGKVLDLLPADDPFRPFAISGIAYAYFSLQDVAMARKTMEENRRFSLARGNYYMAIAATFHLANLAYYRGQLQYAMNMCYETQASIAAAVANPEQELPAVGGLDIVQGCLLLEENRLDEAEQKLLHGLELIEGTNNPFYRMIACTALFRLCEIREREAEAFRFLDDMESTWPDVAFYTQGLRLMHSFRTSGQDHSVLARAERWCREFAPYVSESIPVPGIGPFGGAQAYYVASLIWVQAQIRLEKSDETLSYLERQRAIAEAQGLTYRLIELCLAEAQARKSLGEDQRSLELIGRALDLAKSAGCVRVFDQGPALFRLLEEAGRHGIERDFVSDIIKAMGAPDTLETGKVATRTGGEGTRDGYESLSERELEVLRLMAAGSSNQRMADHLVITVGTVKSHVNHILSKLDVHNRLEAVACARDLGLL